MSTVINMVIPMGKIVVTSLEVGCKPYEKVGRRDTSKYSILKYVSYDIISGVDLKHLG